MVGSDAGQDELCQVLLSELAAALLLPLALRQGGGEVAGDMGVLVAQGQKDGAGNELAEGIFQGGETWRQCPSNWARTSNMSPSP